MTSDDTAGSIIVIGAPLTAVSLSISGDRSGVAAALSDAGPTPATDATGALVIHLTDEPGTCRIIVHY